MALHFTLASALLLLAFGNRDRMWATDPTEPDPYLVTIDTRPWIEALRSDDLFESDPAIDRLGTLGDLAVPALHAALKIEAAQARINIVEVLRDIHTPATVPPLIDAAGDANEEVRRDAIEALGRLGDQRAQPLLEAALHDPSPGIARTAAAACLSLCTTPAALRRLVELSIEESTAASARTSLGRVAGGGGERREQIRVLVDEIALPVMNDGGAANRFFAALVVADTGNVAALPVLQECTSKKPHPLMAVMCIQSMGSSGSERAVPALVEMAQAEDPLLRAASCKALGSLVEQSAVARQAYAGCAAATPPQKPSQRQ